MDVIPNEERESAKTLSKKTDAELQFLLERQQRMFNNKKFLAKLPDKGEKIGQLLEKIKHELKLRADVAVTSGLFHKLTVVDRSQDVGDGGSVLEEIVHSRNVSKMVVDERTEESYSTVIQKTQHEQPQLRAKFYPNKAKKHTLITDVRQELKTELAHADTGDTTSLVALQTDSCNRDVISLCSAPTGTADEIEASLKCRQREQAVLQQRLASDQSAAGKRTGDQSTAGQGASGQLTSGERTCTLNVSDESRSSIADSSALSTYSHKTLQDLGDQGKTCPRLRYRYDESLELSSHTPLVHQDGAKVLSLHDSVEVMKQQKTRLERLQAEQTAEKLARGFRGAFTNLEGSSTQQYRETADIDSDETSDVSNEDYPD